MAYWINDSLRSIYFNLCHHFQILSVDVCFVMQLNFSRRKYHKQANKLCQFIVGETKICVAKAQQLIQCFFYFIIFYLFQANNISKNCSRSNSHLVPKDEREIYRKSSGGVVIRLTTKKRKANSWCQGV